MHPVAEYRRELADLRAEVARLTALVAPPKPADPDVPERIKDNAVKGADGIWRNAMGMQVWPALTPHSETEAEHRARVRREMKQAEEDNLASQKRMRGDLPAGFNRWPDGSIRRQDGSIATPKELDAARAEAEAAEARALADRERRREAEANGRRYVAGVHTATE